MKTRSREFSVRCFSTAMRCSAAHFSVAQRHQYRRNIAVHRDHAARLRVHRAVFKEGNGNEGEVPVLSQNLPARCRQLFTLRKVYRYSQKEISSRLNISENTV